VTVQTRGLESSVLPEDPGAEMYELIRELYPICRSLTGDGVRRTLEIISREAPFELTEIPTGTQVFDWTVPPEWNVRQGWIADASGRRLVDFRDCNLHVLGYSVPVRARVSLEDLRPHLFTLPDRPAWIPYRTSYYDENWGFCLSHRNLESLAEGEYDVCIDASLQDGHLTYAELLLPGASSTEVLISSYICHPSVCNDGLSGVALVTMLAKHLGSLPRRYSYRFLLSPGTIGPLAWLSRNEERLPLIRHGLVASCVGDSGMVTYKKSRRGNAEVDRAAVNVLRHAGNEYRIDEFQPWGGDERQFCSPGFDLPVGALMRTPPGEFDEYHTSADDLSFVQPEFLGDSFEKYLQVVQVLEGNGLYLNLHPKGEPQLGRRGLYRAISAGAPTSDELAERALLWVLNLSDGAYSLLDISERSDLPFQLIREAADRLLGQDLLRELDG
jgi:aminopeptidase-like protein